jgi:plastocyanin
MARHFVRVLPLVILAVGAAVAGRVLPVAAGGGCRGEASTAAQGTDVRMTGHACFTPTVLYAQPGTTITWTNESSDIHDVAGATLEWGDYEEVRAGGSRSFTFEAPGTYPYYCFLHPGMVGAIVIGDAKAAAAGGQVMPASLVRTAPAPEPSQPELVPASLESATESNGGEPWLMAGLGALAGAGVVVLGAAAFQFSRRVA